MRAAVDLSEASGARPDPGDPPGHRRRRRAGRPGSPGERGRGVVFITERASPWCRRPARRRRVPEAETPQADAERHRRRDRRPSWQRPRPGTRPRAGPAPGEALAPAAAPQPPEADPSLPALSRDAPPSRPSELAPPAAPPAELAPEPDPPAVQQAGAASLELNAALASCRGRRPPRGPNRFVDPGASPLPAGGRRLRSGPDARAAHTWIRIVSAAVAQQQRQAVAEPVRPAATAQPSGPTSTTVARAATNGKRDQPARRST